LLQKVLDGPPSYGVRLAARIGRQARCIVERKFRETRLYKVASINNNFGLAHVAQDVLGLPQSD
jgi:hypothetical protein